MMEDIIENTLLCCNFCNKTEDEVVLTEMDFNSLKVGNEIIEFNHLLMELLNLRLEGGFICFECQDQLLQFYQFKNSVKCNFNNIEWIQRCEMVKKLNQFLDDCDFNEELAALRYRQCFTVVPESKRDLMQNFQSWQPLVLLQDMEDYPMKDEEVLEAPIDHYINIHESEPDFDEIIEENDDYTEINEQEIILAGIAQDESRKEEDEDHNELKCKATKEQRQWANELTKACYSVEKQDDGIVPIWSCSFCGKVYHSAQALRLHLLSKQNNWIMKENQESRNFVGTDCKKIEWTCRMCKFVASSNRMFQSHLTTCHMDDINLELYNDQSKVVNFSAENALKLQMEEHAKKQPKQNLSTISNANARPRKSKLVKFEWTCKDCWFQFSNQRSFDSHKRLHETLKGISEFTEIHYCPEEDCSMFFRNANDLAIHTDGHSENQIVLIPAEGVALQKTILFKRLQAPSEEGSLNCGHCDRKFDDELNCKSHLLIQHVNPLVCPRDGRPFNAIQPYVCHLQKVHSDMLPQSLLCTHCKESFANIYERLAHMKICDEKKFACDHCDKKFSNKNYLNSHLKRELGLLSVKCIVCGKILKAKDELKIHMRSHTKERPYKCSICSKSYTTTSARASHMETHKETPIQCEECPVKFVARRHYIVHYKRFHDEVYRARKFQELSCKLCTMQFLRKDRLRDHMQKCHNDQ